MLFFIRFRNFLSARTRVHLALAVGLVHFLLITFLVKVDTIPATNFFVFLMISVVIIAFYSGFTQSGLFLILAKIPAVFTVHLLNGQGFSGVLVSLSNVFIIWLFPPPDDPAGEERQVILSSFVYFAVASVFIALALVLFFVLHQMRLFKSYLFIHQEAVQLQDKDHDELGAATAPSFRDTLKLVWPLMAAVCLTATITLSLFPTLVASIYPVTTDNPNRIFHDLFLPFTFLLYSLGDVAGRWAVTWLRVVPSRWLLPVSFARVVFYPLLILSNVLFFDSTGNPVENRVPGLLASDGLLWAIVLLLGLTNGYFLTLGMMYTPAGVPENHKERASTLAVFSLYAGLLGGSLLSFLIRGLMCFCNPFLS